MKICVCGWYFNEEFLDDLVEIDYPVTVIANRDGLPEKYPFEYQVRENKGLEYGAYDYYLKNLWDGGSVLFMHDDMTLLPIMRNFEIVGPNILFKTISELDYDLAYIFKNEKSRAECFDIHGRVMFASEKFLKILLSNGGFPWDSNNDGYTIGDNPGYCEHYNWAVAHLKMFWEKLIGYKIGPIIIPAFDYSVRGAN